MSTVEEALAWRDELRSAGKTVAFTNGIFDLLHVGHVELLRKAREQADNLVVGLNTDASTRRLKGPLRPLFPEQDRARVLAALAAVDVVVLFDEDTPEALVRRLAPDVLVKGADYDRADIAGGDFVESRGGRVVRVPLVEGRSTSALVEEIARRHLAAQKAEKA